ncbi:hypothetical protein LDENG_00176070 [Lucifuga dentata]|nr:hypothetical protein LDENG_00176070 [Lucifuga dentata]
MPGSHMLPGYYGMRRPFISDADFCPSAKQFSSDVYPSTLGGKALGCEPPMTGYSSLIDSYYPETFGDYRSAAAFSSSGVIAQCTILHWRSAARFSTGRLYRDRQQPFRDELGPKNSAHLNAVMS